MHSRQELADHFRKLGVAPGDTVMLHASIRAVGAVAGGPDQIHLALKDALTADGMLIMYAGCPRHFDELGRGRLTPDEEKELVEKLPPFDPQTARADRDNGALVELLRSYPDSRASSHPARFVAWGGQAETVLSDQPWHFAVGRDSPLDRLQQRDGKILLLGSDHDQVTFLHYVEHVADFSGKRVARYRVPIEEAGKRVWREVEEFNTAGDGVHPHWPDRFFAKIVDGFLAKTNNQGGLVGDARSWLFSARGLLESAMPIMKSVAADARAAAGLRERAR